jgi:hypothetical protein
VINPFNARMSALLVPTGRGVYADADMVIILFDGEATARDGKRCRNTYTWYYQMSQHLHLVLSNEGRASVKPSLSSLPGSSMNSATACLQCINRRHLVRLRTDPPYFLFIAGH